MRADEIEGMAGCASTPPFPFPGIPPSNYARSVPGTRERTVMKTAEITLVVGLLGLWLTVLSEKVVRSLVVAIGIIAAFALMILPVLAGW